MAEMRTVPLFQAPGSATNADRLTLRDGLASHAVARPCAPALLAPGYPALSYADLSGVVERAGAWLASNGLGAGSRVAVCLPSGMALAIAVLAVGCHATVVALHPGLTEAELAALLAEARADAVLGRPDDPLAAHLARQQGITHLALDLERLLSGPTETQAGETDMRAGPAPDDTAFVLFTSGTTGKPKRVPLSHRQVMASAFNIARHLGLAPDDRGLCLMPLFHSHGLVGGLLAPLAAGSSVVCTPGFDGSAFLSWLAEFAPTWYTAAPTIHRAVADLALQANGALPTHSLRFIRSASSALPPELLRRLESLWGTPVIESYGMTESATQMASNPLPPGLRKAGSVGLPAGAALRVIGAGGTEQPAGSVGSIVARGPVVFSGYEDAPTANAEAFKDGWFVTGDLGWFDTDGYLHIVGRDADIINRGGEKFAPFDIEQALLRLPAVAQAAAYPVPHPTLGQDVHAAVVLAPGCDADPHALRTALFGTLAAFKIPAHIHVLDEIPAGVGGKLQRRQLHAMIERGTPSPRGSARTFTAIEARTARLFAGLLGRPVAGPDDNFLALGGDSLSAARLAQVVNETWGVELSASAVLAAPTVGAFAALLQAAIDDADALGDALQNEIDQLTDEDIERLLHHPT
jgi:acyl-CoA synthetase (AMP-forming)/AMP-acid ligase II